MWRASAKRVDTRLSIVTEAIQAHRDNLQSEATHADEQHQKPYARDKEGIISVFHYSYRQLLRLANVLATIIATVLPITAAVVLYHIGRMDVRLGVVAVFTMAFSVIMATVTDARRVQIFVSTVA